MGRKAFIGGCALSSYNPDLVLKTIEHLKTVYPDLSVIQKCCGKPTKAVGQEEKFHERFDGLTRDLEECGVDEVIVACQSCYKTMGLNPNIKVTSLWSLFPEIGLPPALVGKAKNSDVVFSMHDSCSIRPYKDIHEGIRWIMTELGYNFVEPEKTKDKTRCCGFGGMVVPANPEVAKRVMERRVGDFPTEEVVTYCAACRQSMLLGGAKAWHILDLVYGDVVKKGDAPPVDTLSQTMTAWGNRFKTKQGIKKIMAR